MQEGWKCPQCNNIYAPNTAFCLFCWINKQQKKDTILQPEKNDNINTLKVEKNTPALANKDLFLEKIDIDIPVLNKVSNIPIATKWPDTKIYLGGMASSKERTINRTFKIPYILDSIIDLPIQPSLLVKKYFDYIKKNDIKYMLDSGAFSYMNNPKKSLKLTELLDKYCYYINEFDIKDFFELDLDVFMPLDEVENIRKKIYLETHKLPIIVYHENRGHDYWIKMCKENEFIAIGGIVTSKKGNDPTYQKMLLELCDEAHSYGTKVHGLGFTPLNLLNSHTMFFDTVDSTSWNASKFGNHYTLNEKNELVKNNTLRDTFSTVEAQDEDLKVWSIFASKYQGATRII